MKLITAGIAGAVYGCGLGVCLIAACSVLIGGPVAPVAQITLLYFPTVLGALLGVLAAVERVNP